jgi:hypothetical protein
MSTKNEPCISQSVRKIRGILFFLVGQNAPWMGMHLKGDKEELPSVLNA